MSPSILFPFDASRRLNGSRAPTATTTRRDGEDVAMTADAPDRPFVRYETPAPKVARIWLDRADARNAQDTKLLYELNDAFDRAARDDDVSVIVLAAEAALVVGPRPA